MVCSVNDSDSLFDKRRVSEAETGDFIMYAPEGKLFQHDRRPGSDNDICQRVVTSLTMEKKKN